MKGKWSVGVRFLVLCLLAFILVCNTACIQMNSLRPESAVVKIRYEQPDDESPVGIRSTIAGSGMDISVNDRAFADEKGYTTIITHRLQNTYVVARGVDYDVAYGNVDVAGWDRTYTVSSLVGPGATTATTTVSPPALTRKTTGEALIVWFEQDWSYGTVTSVSICGQDAHFEPDNGMRTLYDDGSNGDFRANDGVWSVRFSPGTTSYGYAFVINGHTDRLYRDPHEESSALFTDRDGFRVRRSLIKIRM